MATKETMAPVSAAASGPVPTPIRPTVPTAIGEKAAPGASRRDKFMFQETPFDELAVELAEHLKVADQIRPLVGKKKNDEILLALVTAAPALHSMPELTIQSAYNLLVYLVFASPNYRTLLPKICDIICTTPMTSSPVHGTGIGIFVLQTIFNLLDDNNDMRYQAYSQILRFAKAHNMFDQFKTTLPSLPTWLDQWKTGPAGKRSLYVKIAEFALNSVEFTADAAQSKENESISFQFLKAALKTFTEEEASCEEAQKLALRLVRMSLLSPYEFTFADLAGMRPISSLAETHPAWNQLLEIFMEQDLEDHVEFLDEHKDFLKTELLDGEKLYRKMRLLTFTSLAAHAASGTREIEYQAIASALQVPIEEVEVWCIDAIRAGLVQGKMSQQRKVFLIHSAKYRVFSEKQWRELSTRIQTTTEQLTNVIATLDKGEKEVLTQQRRDDDDISKKMSGMGMDGNRSGNRRGGGGRDRD